MRIVDSLRVWWQRQTGEEETPFDGDAPAWVISLMVHIGVLAVLTALTLYLPRDEAMITLSTETPIDEEDLQLPEEFYFSEVKTEEIGANSLNGAEMAEAMAPTESEVSDVPTPELEAEVGQIVVETTATIATGPNVSSNVIVKGAYGQGTTGAMGAVDRITHEILLSLEQRPTMVVWLFDKSGSLQRQREAIIDRFDRIYHELGVIEQSGNKAFAKHEDKPLLTAVVGFGSDFQIMTPEPTDSVDEIKAAVAAIQNDSSGQERVFAAVHAVADKYKGYRVQEPRRNVMIVCFSDEAGDDSQLFDPAVEMCRKFQMPVYVVGVPAPFGRSDVEIKYRDPSPEFDQSVQWIAVHQGPETLMPERVKLHFTGTGGRDEPIDSGFGPYALTRLCYETGGIYFAVHPNRNSKREVSRRETAELSAHLNHFFDPTIMRRYRPNYVSTDEYRRLLTENKARAALVQAAQLSFASPMESPRLRFPKRSEADLANMLTDAQKDAAKLEPKVQRIYAMLAIGEKDRPKLAGVRWQAGYDLAMGRTLAVMTRTMAYNAMLAKAKQGMRFKDEKNDTWVLKPADVVSVGSQLEKAGKKAREYLERVVREHEGTPWAMLAAKELEDPIGWEWTETYTGVNAPRNNPGAGNGNPNPADDKRNMMKKPKPKRRPKL